MPISPGPPANSGTSANTFEVRATDPYESGHEVTSTKGANGAGCRRAGLLTLEQVQAFLGELEQV